MSKGAVLAIDHGEKRTGFAFVDALRIHSAPLEVFHGPGSDNALVDHVTGLLTDRDIDTVVVGYPLHADKTVSDRARVVDAFIARLAERFPKLRIVRQDEYLSTKAAEDLLAEAGHFGAERKARRDSWSAWVILRDWLAAGEPD